MTDYERVGFTAEKYAEIATDLLETMLKKIDINGCIREVNERHPELTDEQRALIQLDRQYTDEEINKYIQEAFGAFGGLKGYIRQALTGVVDEEVPDDDDEEG